MLKALAAAQEEEEHQAEAERRRAEEEQRLAEEAEERRAKAERQRVAAEQRAEEQRSEGGNWAVMLNRRMGYNLTTVHHRPPKKMTSTSTKSPRRQRDRVRRGLQRREWATIITLCLTIVGCADSVSRSGLKDR